MKTKVLKSYIYEGLGFPVKLQNVTMKMVSGEWLPKIDVRKVADDVITQIPFQTERLTGSQIAFIRSYFRMSLRDFASEIVHESHVAVSKWEKFGHSKTNMDINIEKMIRLHIIKRHLSKTVKQRNSFFSHFEQITDTEYIDDVPVLSISV